MNPHEEQIRKHIEQLLQEHEDWANDEVQQVLLEVARERIWRRGLWARLRFVINIIGFIGFVAGAILSVKALFGWQ